MIDQLNEQIEALDAENNQIKHESRSQMDSTRSRINKLGAEFEAALAQIQQYSELEKAYKQVIFIILYLIITLSNPLCIYSQLINSMNKLKR
jgi:DNA-binding ferritin-like protein (Dps family)